MHIQILLRHTEYLLVCWWDLFFLSLTQVHPDLMHHHLFPCPPGPIRTGFTARLPSVTTQLVILLTPHTETPIVPACWVTPTSLHWTMLTWKHYLFIFIIYFFKHTHICGVVGECQTGALSLGIRVNIKHSLKKSKSEWKGFTHNLWSFINISLQNIWICFHFKNC